MVPESVNTLNRKISSVVEWFKLTDSPGRNQYCAAVYLKPTTEVSNFNWTQCCSFKNSIEEPFVVLWTEVYCWKGLPRTSYISSVKFQGDTFLKDINTWHIWTNLR